MSVQGTGIAAAVAQTGLQAQQVGRQQATRRAERARTARRLREAFETQLQEVEESDAVEAEAPLLRISTAHRDASQHNSPPDPSPQDASPEQATETSSEQAAEAEAEPVPTPGTAYAYDADGQGPPPPPRHHLDVQA